MKAATGKLTASKDRHVCLSLLVAAALAFFGCNNGGGGGEPSSSSAGVVSSSSIEVSSSSVVEVYAFCVFFEYQACTSGSFTSCTSGGVLSQTCPYNSSSSSSAGSLTESSSSLALSSSEILPSSSSGEVSSSSSSAGSLTESSSSLVPSSSSVEPSSSSLVPSSSSVEPSSSSLVPSSSSIAPSSSSLVPSSSSIAPSSSSIAPSSSSEAIPSSSSQQVVISPPVNVPFFEDFEGTNEWTIISSVGANYWMTGTGTSYAGSRSAYITNNGSDNDYTMTNPSTSNIYREINFPSQSPGFNLSFYWKSNGQSTDDYMTVYLVPSSVNVTNAKPSTSYRVGSYYRGTSSWSQENMTLSGSTYSGGTYKLVFHWQNDASFGNQPPGAIDDVSITVYTSPPVTYQGETYETVVIGTQTWFARNLNYNAEGSKCYDNDESNCATYGRLYNWATAMDLPSTCNSSITCSSKSQGICPTGWHIPSDEEWSILINYVDGTGGSLRRNSPTAGWYLKATSGWNDYKGESGNGQDTYGFAALPGGAGNSAGYFGNVGSHGYWWSRSQYDASKAYDRDMSYDGETQYSYNNKTYDRSVRCVQD